MPDLVDVLLEDARWQSVGFDVLAETAAQATLTHLKMDAAQFEISIMACDDARIAVLNEDFREKAKPTNVLSWPSEERSAGVPGQVPDLPVPAFEGLAEELGDIAISYDTCAREATAAGRDFKHHVTHLLVHGVLHLLGYDHIDDLDAALMEGLEVQILGNLGLDDPYSA